MAIQTENSYNWYMNMAMEKILKITKRLEVWLFYFFLLTMTLSIRKILYMRQIRSSFNEYTNVYIYLSDIALISVFLLFILNNKKDILSNIKLNYKAFVMFHVEHCVEKNNTIPRGTKYLKKTYSQVVNKYWIIFPLVAVLFSFFSILWTTHRGIALFRSVKLLEFVFLYFYVAHIVSRGTNKYLKNTLFHVKQLEDNNVFCKMDEKKCSMWNILIEMFKDVSRGTILRNSLFIIVVVGVIQSIVAIFQFISQKSLGFLWLKESIISSSMAGVAKVVFDQNVFIRSYGLFPHPNILGGYLVLSIACTFLFMKLFHMEQLRFTKLKNNCSTWNNYFENLVKFVSRGTNLSWIMLFLQTIALMLTFSKSAIIGLLMGFFYLYFASPVKIVPHGTSFNEYFLKMFHVKQFKKILLMALIGLFGIMLLKPNLNSILLNSLRERNFYLNVSRETIVGNLFSGVGAGQFVFEIDKIENVESWQFQPVHNVFLLIFSEYGLIIFVGFLLFLYLIACSTWNNLRNNINDLDRYLFSTLLAYIFIMMFDHYFWDIQQGSMVLWILLGVLVGRSRYFASVKP